MSQQTEETGRKQIGGHKVLQLLYQMVGSYIKYVCIFPKPNFKAKNCEHFS